MKMASRLLDLSSQKKQIARAAHFFFYLAKCKFARAAHGLSLARSLGVRSRDYQIFSDG